MKQQLNYEQLPQLAIAEGATTPNPGGAGVVVYSTTLAKPVWWNGSSWSSTFGAGSGGVTSFNGRTGAVSPQQADYDTFFTTPAEAAAAAPVQSVSGTAGQISANTTAGAVTLALTNTGVAAGSFTNANITVDEQGRITAAANGAAGGGGGAVTGLQRVTANVAYSTPASTAANLEANTNRAEAFSTTVNANEAIYIDALLDFTTAAATTGIAVGVNCTTNATGTANVKLTTDIRVPVTNAAAATVLERISGVASTTLNATIGRAVLATASVSPQGVRVVATLTNRGSAAVTVRVVFGTEVNNSAVTLLADSIIKHTKQAI